MTVIFRHVLGLHLQAVCENNVFTRSGQNMLILSHSPFSLVNKVGYFAFKLTTGRTGHEQ